MLFDKMFESILEIEATTIIGLSDFVICVGAALIIGMFIAVVYTYKTRYTKSFVVTLATGMGYIGFAFLFSIIINSVILIYTASSIGDGDSNQRTMRITIPEDLDYTNIFDDLFSSYTCKSELISVKTTSMGSLFRITYDIMLTNSNKEKEFIDELRCRNGNLEIVMAKQASGAGEL